MTKYVVEIKKIIEAKKILADINKLNFDDIIWTHKNEVINFDEKKIEEFKFAGLNNSDVVDFLM